MILGSTGSESNGLSQTGRAAGVGPAAASAAGSTAQPALQGRDWWTRDFEDVFQSAQVAVTPPAASPAPVASAAAGDGAAPATSPAGGDGAARTEPRQDGAWWKQDFDGIFPDAAGVLVPEAPPVDPRMRKALKAYRDCAAPSDPPTRRVDTKA